MVYPLLLLGLLVASLDTTVAQIGVCYGMHGDNLPPKPEVIALYKQYGITRMRLYEPDTDALEALRGSNIGLMLGVPDGELERLASNQAEATAWVQNNVIKYSDVSFRYIVVGNEIRPEYPPFKFIIPAIQNIHNAIVAAGLSNQIKVSHAIDLGALASSYPPSASSFRQDFQPMIGPLFTFLKESQSPLLVNAYTYFAYAANEKNPTNLDYSLLRSNKVVVSDPPFSYTNLFDATMDAVYTALEKAGAPSLEVVVSETGWPSAAGADTTLENEQTYNQNLINHVKAAGTPKRPGKPIEVYLFAMFDENLKEPEVEKHWGLFSPNKEPKFQITFN
ncbi:glucan endo-1,3-beta-glucosidase, basic isoform-like [Mangifera indica]|uniref:glucan endo-1,3-beta-glucosidase, basic isoform-like n=1 Tax=Mangifera indica TaxID=29780 RepID=UPI001CFB014F|nr:glucan endo-1,3-beta-glucosidase, basic isoform-like [Mangifera indica]